MEANDRHWCGENHGWEIRVWAWILFCHHRVDSSVVKCCSWAKSFSSLSSPDIPCFYIFLIAVHAGDGKWKGKPTLWSLPSWDFSATSNRPVSFLEWLRRLTGILVFWESHIRLKPLDLTGPSLCGVVKVLLFSLLPPTHTKSIFILSNIGMVLPHGEDSFGN